MDHGELSTGVGIPTRSPSTSSCERPPKTPTKPGAAKSRDMRLTVEGGLRMIPGQV